MFARIRECKDPKLFGVLLKEITLESGYATLKIVGGGAETIEKGCVGSAVMVAVAF